MGCSPINIVTWIIARMTWSEDEDMFIVNDEAFVIIN